MPAPALALYPYQKAWLADGSRFKIGMFARQSGKTFTTTLDIVNDILAVEARKGRTRWVILSRGERQAREAMETLKQHAKAFDIALAAVEGYERGADGAQYNKLDVTFPNGSRVTALPANPDTARGFSANVFLDEFAFHQDSHAIWRALMPVTRKGYRLIVTSTPNGKGNKFYELMTSDALTGVWSRHVVDIHRAVADGLPLDIPTFRAAMNDEDGWAQEFELRWLDEASAWLSHDLIDGAETPECVLGELSGGAGHAVGAIAKRLFNVLKGLPPLVASQGSCFVGVDIAARNDLFVIWVVEQVGDVYWTRDIVARRRIPFAEQDALLDEVFQRYRVVRCCMDQTGMGEKPVEDAQRRYGRYRVEGVLFTGSNKLHLATLGKQAFEDRKIRIPQGDGELRADLHKLKKITGATGTPRFVADSDAGGHADRAWACFLALHAATQPFIADYYDPTRHRQAPDVWGLERGF